MEKPLQWICQSCQGQDKARQWFLTIFTNIILLSNKISRFTTNTLNGAHLLKIRNLQTLTV